MLVILKPTTACNGTCLYCSAVPRGERAETLDAVRLGPLFDAFARWLAADGTRRLDFLWHGGEPMAMGVDYYRHAASEQARAFGAARDRVTNRMQSNLTLLDDDWLAFLPEFVAGVGTSYDPVPGIRGVRTGEPVADRWLLAMGALRRAGVRTGVVYVVHRRALPHAEAIYRFFENLGFGGSLRLNPLYGAGRATEPAAADLAIEPAEYARFLIDVMEPWFADGCRAHVLPLREWHAAWHGGHGALSCDSRGACQERMLGVDARGDLYGCGRLADESDEALRLGNVFEDDLDVALRQPLRQALAGRSARLEENGCRDCRYWDLCHGGCPAMAYLYYGDPLRETYFCAGRKQVYAALEARLGPPRRVVPSGGSGSAEAAT